MTNAVNGWAALWMPVHRVAPDYHVTGLNPANNACLADLAFVAARFRIVQSKVMR